MIKDVDLAQLKKDLGHHYSEFLSFIMGITDENIDRIVHDKALQLTLITEKIVIAPNPWFEADSHRFEDIIPRSWIKIER